MNFKRCALLLFLLLLSSFSAQTGSAEEKKTPVFESDIQPIFSAKCGKCHWDKVRKGGLDLSRIEGLHKGGESGESSLAESVDESLLWIMIDGGGMPPDDSPQLTEDELALIRKWLETGAQAEQPIQLEEEKLNQHDVLPIVLLRCTACHGAELKRGGLDLRTPASMQKGGEHGPAFVAGKPEESLMIKRIESQACPPRELLLKFFVRRPPESEVEKLKNWIAAGAPVADIAPDVATTGPDPLVTAEDREHWAFQPPQAPQGVKSIDELIQKQLKAHELDFSPEAD
ncbi:MAG: c-type cytochrome domain-containing protein, partial [Gimesia chilikensis]